MKIEGARAKTRGVAFFPFFAKSVFYDSNGKNGAPTWIILIFVKKIEI